MAKKIGKIWTSELVALEIEKKNAGADYDSDPFYSGDSELRRAGLNFALTPEETQEYIRCVQDPIYFVEKYCNFLTDYGRKPVILRDYQKNILNNFSARFYDEERKDLVPKNRNIICMASRQTGKTTTTVSFLAHYLISNTDRNILVMANKMDTSKEIVNKLSEVFKGLPFFLKPGVKSWGAKSFKLDNDCMLMSQATTKTASIGFTIHVLYLDEAAHVPENIMDTLWRSVYPTLSSSSISQCIISSTPNGMTNKFYKLWDGSQTNQNSFLPIRVDYWEVPGHDEAWAENMRRDLGDAEFDQEFALSFNVNAKTFISPNDLGFFNKLKRDYVYRALDLSLDHDQYYNLKWDPSFNVYNIRKNDPSVGYLLSIDTGEGKEQGELKEKENDYNICNIFKVELTSIAKMRKLRPNERTIHNIFRLRQVGVYRDNINDEKHVGKLAACLMFELFGEESSRLLAEMNFNGKVVIDAIQNHESYEDEVIVRTFHTKPIPGEKRSYKKAGYKTNSNKDYYCKEGRKEIRSRRLITNEEGTIKELGSFGEVDGKLKGIGTKDDLTISTLFTSHFTTTPEYEEWLENILMNLHNTKTKEYALGLLKLYVDDDSENAVNDLKILSEASPETLFDQRTAESIYNSQYSTNEFYTGLGNFYGSNNQENKYIYKPSSTI